MDYANVFVSLEKALAIYGAGQGGRTPVRDKTRLVEVLRMAVEATTAFCATHHVTLAAIEQLPAGNLERLHRIGEAVNARISPDPRALEFAGRVACIAASAAGIRSTLNPNPADISGVMNDLGRMLDQSIAGVDMPEKPAPVMDLSKIDFEALRRRFRESKQRNTDLEVLKAAIRSHLDRLIRLNKTRVDFAEKFEESIDSYNAGSRNIEQLFADLLDLSRNPSEEQQRHVREHLSEEEWTVFDLLTRPGPELTPEEREEVKKVAR